MENVGETAAGPFWVDLYDNPATPPTEANQPWNSLCSGDLADCCGIAWYVAGGLGAGENADADTNAYPDTGPLAAFGWYFLRWVAAGVGGWRRPARADLCGSQEGPVDV
ncbi:MAG: hypothetical protein KAW49_02445 [Anaerolineae bacterium]|nr:hypothetical protein [Anaerolineae bacterium]